MKKRILLVSSGKLDQSGVPSVIMAAVRTLSDVCTFDLLLTTDAEGYYDREFRQYGGRILRVPKKHFRFAPLQTLADVLRPLSLYCRTRAILRQTPYDGIHCHNEFDMAGCLAAAAAARVPLRAAQVHRTWSDEGTGPLTRLYRTLCRRVINARATIRLGCSAAANDAFYGKTGAEMIVTPYDESRFVPDRASRDGVLRIVQVGYFCENKNQLFSLEVFRHLAAARPDAELLFVGSDAGRYGQKLRERIRETGLEQRVRLYPADADIPALLRTCSLMLFPSRAEGFGIVLIEAQAMGLACCASDQVPRETDCGGVTYLPLSAGPAAWAEAILRERRYETAQPCDVSAFTTAAYTAQLRRIYGV